jgi:hypothetical protein
MAAKKAKIPAAGKTTKTTKLNLDSLKFANIGMADATATMFSPPTNIYGEPYGMPAKDRKLWFPTTAAKGSGGSGGGVKPKANKGPWYYNAPMVKSAYYNPLSLPKAPTTSYEQIPIPGGGGYYTVAKVNEGREGLFHFVHQGNYDDALKAWTINKDGSIAGGKGTIQMDREYNNAQTFADVLQKSKQKKSTFDPNMYGFKFLYNPKEISMAWGSLSGVSPEYMSSGQSTTAPVLALSSTINVDLMLNRIEDMNVLKPDGSYVGSDPYPTFKFPSNKDRKKEYAKIHNWGTMYDIEYLLKTLHGFHTNWKSTLRGETNDPGWLPLIWVELHLGNTMRYRVRVENISVNHVIFNSQMVPVLTTVSLTCRRQLDVNYEVSK